MSIKLSNEMWDLDLEPTEKLVGLAFADRANDEGRQCWPSVEWICERTGLGERTVRRTIAALERKRVLTRHHRAGASTQYHVHPCHYGTPATAAPLPNTTESPAALAPTPATLAPNTPISIISLEADAFDVGGKEHKGSSSLHAGNIAARRQPTADQPLDQSSYPLPAAEDRFKRRIVETWVSTPTVNIRRIIAGKAGLTEATVDAYCRGTDDLSTKSVEALRNACLSTEFVPVDRDDHPVTLPADPDGRAYRGAPIGASSSKAARAAARRAAA